MLMNFREIIQRLHVAGIVLRELPFELIAREHRVYLLIDRNVITYIGKTSRLPGRLLDHQSEGKQFDRVCYWSVDNDQQATDLEARLIRLLKPRDNRQAHHQNGLRGLGTRESNWINTVFGDAKAIEHHATDC